MKVRVKGGYLVVLRVEEKVLREIDAYNKRLEEIASGFKVSLAKSLKRKGHGKSLVLRYIGLTWSAPTGKGRYRRGGIPVEIVDKIPAPPRFPLEGLECIVENLDIILDYSVYKKYSMYFRGLDVEPLGVDVNLLSKEVCMKAFQEAKEISHIAKRDVTWVPLSRIVKEVSLEHKMNVKDVVDALFFLKDQGLVVVERGDGNSLWLNLPLSCREVR